MLQGPARYVKYLRGLLRANLPAPQESSGRITLGYGRPLAALVLGQQPAADEFPPADSVVVDSFGHQRPAYRGLLVHAWARAICLGWQPRQMEILQQWLTGLSTCLENSPLLGSTSASASTSTSTEPLAAAMGLELCQGAWAALAVYSGGVAMERPQWTQLGHQFFDALLSRAQPGGTFMQVGADDNLEPWWYHELVLLHAATTYAAPRRDARWQAFLSRSAEHHFAQTQPDHASTQPWGVHAFLLFPHTMALADQMIHASVTQGGGHPEAVSAILFADALDCLARS